MWGTIFAWAIATLLWALSLQADVVALAIIGHIASLWFLLAGLLAAYHRERQKR
jgi:hypothetical protein